MAFRVLPETLVHINGQTEGYSSVSGTHGILRQGHVILPREPTPLSSKILLTVSPENPHQLETLSPNLQNVCYRNSKSII